MNARTVVVNNNTVSNLSWGSAAYTGNLHCLDYILGTADSLNVSTNTITNITKNGAGTSSLFTSTFRNAGGAGTRGFIYEFNTVKSVVTDNIVWGHYAEARTSVNQGGKKP